MSSTAFRLPAECEYHILTGREQDLVTLCGRVCGLVVCYCRGSRILQQLQWTFSSSERSEQSSCFNGLFKEERRKKCVVMSEAFVLWIWRHGCDRQKNERENFLHAEIFSVLRSSRSFGPRLLCAWHHTCLFFNSLSNLHGIHIIGLRFRCTPFRC